MVADVATGTAAVAIDLARRHGCRVIGIDQSPEMLARGAERVADAGLAEPIELRQGEAERLPLDDASVDALTHTYLLRYVDDPAATLRELARVVKPGGAMASLEFFVPDGAWYPAVVGVDADRPAGRRADRRRRVVRDRQVPRAEHRGVLAPASARRRARDVAGGRDGADLGAGGCPSAEVSSSAESAGRERREVCDGFGQSERSADHRHAVRAVAAAERGARRERVRHQRVVCDPGEDFDIAHDETETGQQEAYIVVTGRAAFTVGDERIEAGPGTVVAAPDPAVTRGYEALEPGTRIVCVGATPAADKQPFGEWIADAANA